MVSRPSKEMPQSQLPHSPKVIGNLSNIVVHTRMHFLCNVYPYTPFSPSFCYYSYLFWPLPPTNGAFVDRLQYGIGRV